MISHEKTDGGIRMRKRHLHVLAVIIAAAVIAMAAFIIAPSLMMSGGDGNDISDTANVSNINVTIDGDDVSSSHGLSSDNMHINQSQEDDSPVNDNASNEVGESDDDNEPDASESSNESGVDPYIDAMRVDTSNIPIEERQGVDYLDRDKLRDAVRTFIPIYFDTMNPLQRKQELGPYVDWEYVSGNESSYGIYYDLVYNNGAGGGIVPDNASFVEMGDVTIDNANRNSPTCRCDVTYSYAFKGEETKEGTRGKSQDVTITQTVKILLNESYQIRDVKFV